MVATVPILKRSFTRGSSLFAFFWATSNIFLSPLFAFSIAWIDFSLPTKSGMTSCGYTTTSRSGSMGKISDFLSFMNYLFFKGFLLDLIMVLF